MSTSKPRADHPRRGNANYLSGWSRVNTPGLRWSSSTSTSTTTTNYTVGGTISGLTVSSVVLAERHRDRDHCGGREHLGFSSSFTAGSSYSVTVQTQPVGELCEVTSGGSGMDTGSVGNVTVVCGFGQWSWEGGLITVNASGVYGTQGSASASNLPGARYSATAPGPTRPATSGCSGGLATTQPAV